MRRSPLLLASAFLPLLLASPAAAQTRWKEIGRTSVGNPVSIDPRSVKKASGIVTATVRVTFVTPVATPQGPLAGSRTVAMFDCAKRVVAVKENTYFHDRAQTKVYQRTAPKVPGYSSPIKGTLPDVAMQYLCAP